MPYEVPPRTIRLLLTVLVAGACWCVSSAQERSLLEPPDPELYRRWGPLRARPGFEVTNFGYDSNIVYAPEGREVPDYTITLSPRLDGLFLFGGRAFLTFRERFSYTAYLENSNQNNPNNRFQTRFTLPINRAGVFAEMRLDNVQQRPTDVQDIRTRLRDRTLQAGLILEPGWRTEIEISREVRGLAYTDPDEISSPGRTVGDILDRTETGTNFGVTWLMMGRTRLVLETSLDSIDFAEPGRVGSITLDRDGDAWRVLPGVRFGQGGSLLGEFKLGWGRYTARDSRLPEFNDWIGELDLSYRLGSRTRLIFNGERLPGFSLLQGALYYLDTDLGVRAIHYLTRVIGVEAGTSRGRITFPGSVFLIEREDRIKTYDAGLRVRVFTGAVGERTEYSLRIRRYNRDSTVPGLARSQTTFTFGAAVGF